MSIDALGVSATIARIPEFLWRGREEEEEIRVGAGDPHEVIVVGRTVAAHATRFVTAALGPTLAAPVTAVSAAAFPSRVDAAAAVVAVCLSAADRDVRDVARKAADKGAFVVLLQAPGARHQIPGVLCRELPEVPRERFAIYAIVGELLRLFEAFGLADGVSASLDEAATRAELRLDGHTPSAGIGGQVARRLGETFPLLVGAPGVGAAAARWWEVAVAANARRLAHAASTVEYEDALLAAFGQSGDVTRQVTTLVLLRCASETAAARAAFAAIEEWATEAVADVVAVEGLGNGPLAQLVDLAVQGDLTSVALAGLAGIDPGPAPVIDRQE